MTCQLNNNKKEFSVKKYTAYSKFGCTQIPDIGSFWSRALTDHPFKDGWKIANQDYTLIPLTSLHPFFMNEISSSETIPLSKITSTVWYVSWFSDIYVISI